MTIFECCICRQEVDVDSEDTVLVKTYFDKDFAHKECAEKIGIKFN